MMGVEFKKGDEDQHAKIKRTVSKILAKYNMNIDEPELKDNQPILAELHTTSKDVKDLKDSKDFTKDATKDLQERYKQEVHKHVGQEAAKIRHEVEVLISILQEKERHMLEYLKQEAARICSAIDRNEYRCTLQSFSVVNKHRLQFAKVVTEDIFPHADVHVSPAFYGLQDFKDSKQVKDIVLAATPAGVHQLTLRPILYRKSSSSSASSSRENSSMKRSEDKATIYKTLSSYEPMTSLPHIFKTQDHKASRANVKHHTNLYRIQQSPPKTRGLAVGPANANVANVQGSRPANAKVHTPSKKNFKSSTNLTPQSKVPLGPHVLRKDKSSLSASSSRSRKFAFPPNESPSSAYKNHPLNLHLSKRLDLMTSSKYLPLF